VVPADRLTAANALIGGLPSSVTIVAPAVAGVVVAVVGPGAGFGLGGIAARLGRCADSGC
jgi:hypothetical protein